MFKNGATPAEFAMWSGLGGNEVVTTHHKQTPPTPRVFPSLANYADEYIFVIAGKNVTTKALYTSVDMYTIETDTWSQAPSLEVPRVNHSSCVAGDTLFIFGGRNNDYVKFNSIQMLRLDKFFSGVPVAWEIIELYQITPRYYPVIAPFSATEVFIAGGYVSNGDYCGDGFVFNLNDKSINSCITETEFKFNSSSN